MTMQVGSLPIELVKRGHKVMSIAPRYVEYSAGGFECILGAPFSYTRHSVRIGRRYDQYAGAWDTSVVVNVLGKARPKHMHELQGLPDAPFRQPLRTT